MWMQIIEQRSSAFIHICVRRVFITCSPSFYSRPQAIRRALKILAVINGSTSDEHYRLRVTVFLAQGSRDSCLSPFSYAVGFGKWNRLTSKPILRLNVRKRSREQMAEIRHHTLRTGVWKPRSRLCGQSNTVLMPWKKNSISNKYSFLLIPTHSRKLSVKPFPKKFPFHSVAHIQSPNMI